MKTIRVKIYGKVQNVNMRSSICQKALVLGIKGYVKNNPDNIAIVDSVFQADEKKLSEMIDFIKSSPGRSGVEDVKIETLKSEGFKAFSIRYY
ncbi:acylphosphatase [Candidatus Woesearchaeota archaeon]|nr:acylphosphatase [Candidatus Woesearchaeota archaeon]